MINVDYSTINDLNNNTQVLSIETDYSSSKQLEILMVDNVSIDGKYSWNEACDKVAKLNQQNYKGYSDWKMPSTNNLYTIFSAKKAYKIHISGEGKYWSNTEVRNNEKYVWGINFKELATRFDVYMEYGRKKGEDVKSLYELLKTNQHRLHLVREVLCIKVDKNKKYQVLTGSQINKYDPRNFYTGIYAESIYKTLDPLTPYSVVWIDGSLLIGLKKILGTARVPEAIKQYIITYKYEEIFELLPFVDIKTITKIPLKLSVTGESLYGKRVSIIEETIKREEAIFDLLKVTNSRNIFQILLGIQKKEVLRDGVVYGANNKFIRPIIIESLPHWTSQF